SLGVHLVIMVLLLLVKFHTRIDNGALFLDSVQDIESELAFDATDTDQVGVGSEVTALSPTSSSGAAASADAAQQTAPSVQQETAGVVNEAFKGPQVRIGESEMAMLPDNVLTSSVGGKEGGGLGGGGTENVSGEGVEGAIDRL